MPAAKQSAATTASSSSSSSSTAGRSNKRTKTIVLKLSSDVLRRWPGVPSPVVEEDEEEVEAKADEKIKESPSSSASVSASPPEPASSADLPDQLPRPTRPGRREAFPVPSLAPREVCRQTQSRSHEGSLVPRRNQDCTLSASRQHLPLLRLWANTKDAARTAPLIPTHLHHDPPLRQATSSVPRRTKEPSMPVYALSTAPASRVASGNARPSMSRVSLASSGASPAGEHLRNPKSQMMAIRQSQIPTTTKAALPPATRATRAKPGARRWEPTSSALLHLSRSPPECTCCHQVHSTSASWLCILPNLSIWAFLSCIAYWSRSFRVQVRFSRSYAALFLVAGLLYLSRAYSTETALLFNTWNRYCPVRMHFVSISLS
jgi:hypothetical protein